MPAMLSTKGMVMLLCLCLVAAVMTGYYMNNVKMESHRTLIALAPLVVQSAFSSSDTMHAMPSKPKVDECVYNNISFKRDSLDPVFDLPDHIIRKGNLSRVRIVYEETTGTVPTNAPVGFNMSSGHEKERWCNAFAPGELGWKRVCPGYKDNEFFQCQTKRFVAVCRCCFIDADGTIPGMVYDRIHTYPVHGNHPSANGFRPLTQNPVKIESFTSIAHALTVYPTATAHFLGEAAVRLVFLASHIPLHVKIVVAHHRLSSEFVDILANIGIIQASRIIHWRADTVYYADNVFFAGEAGFVENRWDTTASKEYCSWSTALPKSFMQKSLSLPVVQRTGVSIMVVHRSDSANRFVTNHGAVIKHLRQTFPSATVSTFVGKDHDIRDTMRLFHDADIVLAPHGAALSFMSFMKQGNNVIEFGYYAGSRDNPRQDGGMAWPASYFFASSIPLQLNYFVSMAHGGYNGGMTVDIADVSGIISSIITGAKAHPLRPEAPQRFF